MLPTPDIAHVRRTYGDAVYDPAEDTFALMDALEQDAQVLQNTSLCVEIGSGSGCVSTFAAQLVGPHAAYVCTDINAAATLCTRETAERNHVALDVVRASTLDGLRLTGLVDLLLFNPPYVVTSDEEEAAAQAHADLAGAWAGGTYGTALLQRMIDDGIFERTLRSGGRLYVVTIKQNDPEGLVRQLSAHGLDADVHRAAPPRKS
ncbi:peptide chain release factor N(5)-glutamine methyltransferase [Malassezia brasiliensis]|uniref:Peptide chain release factor N(5)-glutamine methyltransferase n=1 Tax=Malassezia brasiliensis TaxID=1821822 RepID=A0AAF0DRK5_9BASI|nr:peptide chain release factor N(5)-glutamine methyltransferase [Malassezia brasiliensis]